ncbi:VOC family protein [Gammaproteobacteria bacterium AS21]
MLTAINHITIAVSNLQKSLVFYHQLLGFKRKVSWQTGAYMTLADHWFCLSVGEVAPAGDYSHLALSLSQQDFSSTVLKLQQEKVIEWQKNSSEGDSFYFLDPDGHQLELHVGNLESRLNALKMSTTECVYYDD